MSSTRDLAISLFNETWSLLDQETRAPDEDADDRAVVLADIESLPAM